MLTLQTNLAKLQAITGKLRSLKDEQTVASLIAACLPATIGTMQQRIHQHGLAGDGTAFSARSTNKGYLVNSGRLKDELTTLPPAGIGWRDGALADRAKHLQQRYNKAIWQLTTNEKSELRLRLAQQCSRLLQ